MTEEDLVIKMNILEYTNTYKHTGAFIAGRKKAASFLLFFVFHNYLVVLFSVVSYFDSQGS